MANPLNGELKVPAGGKDYTLRVGTKELAKLEGQFKVTGFDAIFERLEKGTVEDHLAVAAIVLERNHPGDTAAAEVLVDELSLRGFRIEFLKLAALGYGGAKGLEDFERLMSLTAGAREAELKRLEEESKAPAAAALA